MKTKDDPQDQIQRTGSQNRKLPILIALAATLLAASSAQATVMITADEVMGNVVFSLSGTFNPASGHFLGSVPAPSSSGFFPRPPATSIQYAGAPGSFVDQYILTNPVGLFFFGSGDGSIADASDGGPFFFGPGGNIFLMYVPQGSSSLTSFSGSMTFNDETFDSLGLFTGVWNVSWMNLDTGSSDDFTLMIGQSVPDTGSTLALLGLGLGGVFALHRRRSPSAQGLAV